MRDAKAEEARLAEVGMAMDGVDGAMANVLVPPEVPPHLPHDEDEDSDEEEDRDVWEDIVNRFDHPDDVVEMNGHVIGMNLTQDGRYLLVNVRPWMETGGTAMDPPPISEEIEVRVVDLNTLRLLPNLSFKGHRGFTKNEECFFIFLDANQRCIASGSEDKKGYVWSRDYGHLLGTLQHDNVVNCVAFNPVDSEMLVSVSDDWTLNVWSSKKKLKQGNQQGETITVEVNDVHQEELGF